MSQFESEIINFFLHERTKENQLSTPYRRKQITTIRLTVMCAWKQTTPITWDVVCTTFIIDYYFLSLLPISNQSVQVC